jgi:DNA invertase Pin-like site-specific DNA recombinase
MKAAVYARYSSENQRPESIADQLSACRRVASQQGYVISEQHIYTDMAASGARKDRPGLSALLTAAEQSEFEIVLVDDLSRLARNNLLMLSILAELRFQGVRIVSVADGLDSNDEDATLGIQVRGIFNELQLMDLRKKTLRGQLGQKERGFSVGERTFGYTSVPVGTLRMDKKGRPRPEGYRMVIEPREAPVVLRVFKEFADGTSKAAIVRNLNEEGVSGRFRSSKGWSAGTVQRILKNPKYVGKWVWNKSETRRDPRTGRRRPFPKPESEWIVHQDETLRIVPQQLWDQVQERIKEISKTWPGGQGKRGFCEQNGGRIQYYPTHLLSGLMVCQRCGATMGQVSGKSGGYYGCLGASKGACDNRLLVKKSLAERVMLKAVLDKISSPQAFAYLLQRVEEEVEKLNKDVPETIHLKEAELDAEKRRIHNFVEFVAEGRTSRALAQALAESERKVEELELEVEALRKSRDAVFKAPPLAWIEERIETFQAVLENRTTQSARLLRKLLGTVQLQPTQGDIGKPYYQATSTLQPLALLEPADHTSQKLTILAPDGGSNSLRWWTAGGSNP